MTSLGSTATSILINATEVTLGTTYALTRLNKPNVRQATTLSRTVKACVRGRTTSKVAIAAEMPNCAVRAESITMPIATMATTAE